MEELIPPTPHQRTIKKGWSSSNSPLLQTQVTWSEFLQVKVPVVLRTYPNPDSTVAISDTQAPEPLLTALADLSPAPVSVP